MPLWMRTSSHLRNPTAIDRMKKLKCCYTGSKDVDPAHFFGAPQQEAIERAERLHDRHKEVVHPRDRNPWTDIHLLVRRLLEQS